MASSGKSEIRNSWTVACAVGRNRSMENIIAPSHWRLRRSRKLGRQARHLHTRPMKLHGNQDRTVAESGQELGMVGRESHDLRLGADAALSCRQSGMV